LAVHDLIDNASATRSEDGMAAANLTQFFSRATRPFKPSGRSKGRRATLAAVMPCLRPADPIFYAEWAGGRFSLAGASIVLADRSPFAVERAPEAWRRALHGFDWLRHIPPSVDPNAALHVEALMTEWLALGRRRDAVAALASVTARRVLSWLAHADILLQTIDADHYDAVMQSLEADIAALQDALRTAPAGPQDSADQLLALIARAAAGLCLEDDGELLPSAETALAATLSDRQPVARSTALRSPALIAELLLELESLRRLYRMQHRDVPEFLQTVIDRMRATIDGLLLGDGSLARLGSERSSTDEKLTLWLLTRHAGISPAPAGHDSRTGFVRLAAGETRLVVDVGAPLAARDALAFEMSTGTANLLVHHGQHRELGRGDSGTLVFAPNTKEPEAASPASRRAPSLEPSHAVATEFAAGAPQHVDATHAGLAHRGFAHRRRLTLSEDGKRLDGNDELRPLVGASAPGSAPFALCFSLHPSVRINLGETNTTVTLLAVNGHSWSLSAPGHAISVEGSAYQDGAAIGETAQLLITADASASRTVSWSLIRTTDAANTSETKDEAPSPAVTEQKLGTLAEALAALTPEPLQAAAVC
jgi:uncharacterized heparinase superfamily protein